MLADLDRGEAEVIALAQELDADLVVIDERLARRHAKRLGLTLTGTLGVLPKAKHLGLIPSVAPLIEQLRQAGVRLSDVVVAEALKLAGEMYAQFHGLGCCGSELSGRHENARVVAGRPR